MTAGLCAPSSSVVRFEKLPRHMKLQNNFRQFPGEEQIVREYLSNVSEDISEYFLNWYHPEVT